MKKRILACLLAALMGLSLLSGCGGGGDAPADPSVSGGEKEPAAQDPQGEKLAADQTLPVSYTHLTLPTICSV